MVRGDIQPNTEKGHTDKPHFKTCKAPARGAGRLTNVRANSPDVPPEENQTQGPGQGPNQAGTRPTRPRTKGPKGPKQLAGTFPHRPTVGPHVQRKALLEPCVAKYFGRCGWEKKIPTNTPGLLEPKQTQNTCFTHAYALLLCYCCLLLSSERSLALATLKNLHGSAPRESRRTQIL